MAAGAFPSPCLLVKGLPQGAFCGIDLLSLSVKSTQFHGIRDIPPGWHFLFTSATDSMSLRHGAWFHVRDPDGSPPDLHIASWGEDEELRFETEDKAAVLAARANVGSVWPHLLPYRQSAQPSDPQTTEQEARIWHALTSSISENTLNRILNGPITSASSSAQDEDAIPGISNSQFASEDETELKLLPINLKQTWPDGAIGRERTEKAQDRSWALANFVDGKCDHDPSELLGELQFCFVMVLTLNNNSCYEQWRRLIDLVLTCRKAALNEPSFFVKFINAVQVQCESCEKAQEAIIDLQDDGPNFLAPLLSRFRAGLDDAPRVKTKLIFEAIDEFEDSMKEKYDWQLERRHMRRGMVDLDDGERVELDMDDSEDEREDGEYAPVVVQLDDGE